MISEPLTVMRTAKPASVLRFPANRAFLSYSLGAFLKIVPANVNVNGIMLLKALAENKIIRMVVSPNTILVVNNFTGIKWSTNFLGHDKAMLKNCSFGVCIGVPKRHDKNISSIHERPSCAIGRMRFRIVLKKLVSALSTTLLLFRPIPMNPLSTRKTFGKIAIIF